MATALERECGPKCRSKQHALQMNASVTKGSFLQCQIFFSTCYNVTNNTDTQGRNVLHLAASCGQHVLMKWLIEGKKMDVNARDLEHGWTALHRSLFYGQLAAARLLIQHNANLTLRDKEGFTALDVAMRDRLPHVTFEKSGLQEVYTWGDNANFTLGHEKEQRKKHPERIEYFGRHGISIKQVLMCKYHSVYLSTAGHVYTCGHGRGGRLGHGNEQTILAPKLIEAVKQEECILVSASNDHTVMLMQSGKVFSCGLNAYSQLGHSTSGACLTPKMMSSLKGHQIIGVIARKFHTVLYTQEAVFTFGLNAGQLGHQKVLGEEIVSQPRLVAAFNHPDIRIKLVSASDAATIVTTGKGDLYALHEYQCRRIASKLLDLVQLSVVGGNLDHRVAVELLRDSGGSDLLIVLRNLSGNVYCWRTSHPVLHRVVWSIKRPLSVKEVAVSVHQLVFVTTEGDAFSTSLSQLRSRSSPVKAKVVAVQSHNSSESMSLTDLVNRENIVEAKVHRIPLVHRATAIAIDRNGVNLAVLQVHPNASITQIPMYGGSVMMQQMKTLLNEADLTDSIHDCVLQVGTQRVPAHAYILAMKSEYFRRYFEKTPPSQNNPIIVKCSQNLLSQLVQYFYTDTCDLLTPGFLWQPDDEEAEQEEEVVEESTTVLSAKSRKKAAFEVYKEMKEREPLVKPPQPVNAQGRLVQVATELGIGGLMHRLKFVKLQKGVVANIPGKLLPQPKIRWDHSKLPELCDVWLKCDDDQVVACHKCILVARVEYFHSMLSTGWIESGSHEPLSLPIPSDILKVVLNYLYCDELVGNKVLNDAEMLCNVLVVADQMLIVRLKELCEVHLSAQVNLKNACELLEFASTYTALQLRDTCQQFIAINLATLLESGSLDLLSDDVIDELSDAYREMVPGVDRRRIESFDGYPSRAYLQSLEAAYSDHWAEEVFDAEQPSPREETPVRKSAPRSRRKRSQQKSVSEENRKTSECEDVEENFSLSESISEQPVSPTLIVPTIQIRSALHVQLTSSSAPQVTSSSAPQMTSPSVQSQTAQPDLRNIMKQQEERDAAQDARLKSKPKKVNRLSQRERKRLNSLESAEATSPPAMAPPGNPWKKSVNNNLVPSFKQLLIKEENDARSCMPSKPIEVPPPQRKVSVPSSIVSPDHLRPWGQAVSPKEVNVPLQRVGPSLSQIVEDEKERHASLQRSLNKPLHLIQIEEQAIMELMESYKAKSCVNEYITVDRIVSIAESPRWQANQ